jgi:hypothetical protein
MYWFYIQDVARRVEEVYKKKIYKKEIMRSRDTVCDTWSRGFVTRTTIWRTTIWRTTTAWLQE